MNKKLMGKKSRAAGARFELKVRADLESKGWIVAKWTNQVEFGSYKKEPETKLLKKLIKELNNRGFGTPEYEKEIIGKLVKAKSFMGRSRTNGFPDFTAAKLVKVKRSLIQPKGIYSNYGEMEFENNTHEFNLYEIIGVESKMNGKLDKTEKEKCVWLLDNNIFGEIYVASKGEKRGEIKFIQVEGGKNGSR